MSENKSQNSKRIAKNTVVLYARSIFVMLVALYTSRVILSALGVSDYGLYNVVGGVVGLFSFLRSAMEKCTQRFLNFGMVDDNAMLKNIFRVSFSIHVLIALAAFILAETVGLWYLNYHIVIPEGRLFAANCVYQSTVLCLLFTILTVPLSAAIIAHEKMGFFALISIIDSVLKLAIAVLISFSSTDRLIFYAGLILGVHAIDFILYICYCRRNFFEVNFRFLWDKSLVKRMFGYISWTLFGHSLIIATNQGNILLINQFFGVVLNAAMAVANQVNSAVLSFTSNFQTAFNPQITKSIASKDYDYLKTLTYSTTKLSFFLLTIISLPLMFNIDFVLGLWLKEVPEFTGPFCILMLISGILQATSAPLNFIVMSTEKIKWFQITTGLVFISDLFIVYGLFAAGLPALTVMVVKIGVMIGVFIVRLIYANRVVDVISVPSYLKDIVLPLFVSTLLSVGFSYLLMYYVHTTIMHLVSIVLIAFTTLGFAFFLGLSKSEKAIIKSYIGNFTRKFQKQ